MVTSGVTAESEFERLGGSLRARGNACTGFLLFFLTLVLLPEPLAVPVIGSGSEDDRIGSATAGIDCVRLSASRALWRGEMGKAEVLADTKLAERIRYNARAGDGELSTEMLAGLVADDDDDAAAEDDDEEEEEKEGKEEAAAAAALDERVVAADETDDADEEVVHCAIDPSNASSDSEVFECVVDGEWSVFRGDDKGDGPPDSEYDDEYDDEHDDVGLDDEVGCARNDMEDDGAEEDDESRERLRAETGGEIETGDEVRRRGMP